MDNEKLILKHWGNKTIFDIANLADLKIHEILEIAFKMEMYNIETEDIQRRWTREEEKFLINKSNQLTIKQVSNLLHRSRYGTYQRVKYLNLEHMINKKR